MSLWYQSHKRLTNKKRRWTNVAEAWMELHQIFAKAGSAPETYVLHNETSSDLLEAFKTQKMQCQLATHHKCRKKQVELDIQIFKSHFKSSLPITNLNFPLSEWNSLIPQTNIKLSLLRLARDNTNILAHAWIFVKFNFCATPLVPQGRKVGFVISSEKRGS